MEKVTLRELIPPAGAGTHSGRLQGFNLELLSEKPEKAYYLF